MNWPISLLAITRTVRSFASFATGKASHRSFCLVAVGAWAGRLWRRGCRRLWCGRPWRHNDVSASANFDDFATWIDDAIQAYSWKSGNMMWCVHECWDIWEPTFGAGTSGNFVECVECKVSKIKISQLPRRRDYINICITKLPLSMAAIRNPMHMGSCLDSGKGTRQKVRNSTTNRYRVRICTHGYQVALSFIILPTFTQGFFTETFELFRCSNLVWSFFWILFNIKCICSSTNSVRNMIIGNRISYPIFV